MIVKSTHTDGRDERVSQYEAIAEQVCERLALDQRVRRNLPGDGRLRFDRQLPFLTVHRQRAGRKDPGTRELVTTEAAYLYGSGEEDHHDGLMLLCQQISSAMQEHFGSFLILELWAQEPGNDREKIAPLSFEIVSAEVSTIPTTIAALQSALNEIVIHGQRAEVTIRKTDRVAPDGLLPLEPVCDEPKQSGCCILGLAVSPIYRDSRENTLFPIVLHSLRRSLAVAIRKTVATFTGAVKNADDNTAAAYHELGPSSFVKAARLVDQQLCDVSESFDFLLQVTPTNAGQARDQFRASGFKKLPHLSYRPLPYRPSLLKRQLFEIEIERIEDPTLAHLFWEKQEELDRQLTALRDLGTPEFLYGSLQLYGEVDAELLKLAQQILHQLPESLSREARPKYVDTEQLLDRVHDELDYYHARMDEFNATVTICDDITAGMMVSHDQLLLAKAVSVPEARLDALMHHEIGTHLLTYFNGHWQPFRLLSAGLSGYEELQEGLAVFAECLVGGMTTNRARTLAGRVIAVHSMTQHNSFAETFAMLHEQFGFTEYRAFTIALRVYRGGGLTKDVIYLRGLNALLNYLAADHEIEPLYVGKIGLQHVPFIQEMRRRKIIVAPRVLPRFWDDRATHDRIKACRDLSVLQLLEIDL